MTHFRVARRYAEALMDMAEEQQQLDAVVEDLLVLLRTAKESREFALFLKSPVIKKEKKQQVLTKLFGTSIRPVTRQFMQLLAEKGRDNALLQIIDAFFQLRDERLGIVPVEVRAATELSKEHSSHLEKRLEGYTKKKVRISFSTDKQLKGGFVAKVGDTVFDGSVTRQLELLRERLVEGEGKR